MLQIDRIYPENQTDLNMSHVFVAIYAALSAPRVAEQLNLAKHTVSYGLATLREAQSNQLLVQDERNFKRTPQGYGPGSAACSLPGCAMAIAHTRHL